MLHEFFADDYSKELALSNIFGEIMDFYEQSKTSKLNFVYFSGHDNIILVLLEGL